MSVPGDSDNWDFGTAAGFYVNATTPGFDKHYNMYDYVSKELPALISGLFPVDTSRAGITGTNFID